MKRISLASMMCVAALSVACNGNGNQADANGEANTGSAMDDRTLGSTGTSGMAADESQAGSQSGASQSGQPAGAAQRNTGAGDTQQFVQQAAIAGMAEVQLGQLAEQRASNQQVKEFGRMMVQDHTKANNELKQTAQSQNIQIPTKLDQKHQAIVDKLQGLRGAEFDREYMRVMVDSHMQVRDLLDDRADNRNGSSTANRPASGATAGGSTAGGNATGATGTAGRGQGNDAAVNQWASKTLPNVEHHLKQAQQISSQLQNSAGGNAPSANTPGGRTNSGSGTGSTGVGTGSGNTGSGTGSGTSGSGSGGTNQGGSGR